MSLDDSAVIYKHSEKERVESLINRGKAILVVF